MASPRVVQGATVTTEGSAPDWQPLTAEALARARSERRLILLSVQADFCHWCHVMNATTYRDPQVVALLREHFVSLRADEAARPDLATRYADYGWPATVILAPDAGEIIKLRGHQPLRTFLPLLQRLVAKLERGEPLAETTPAAPEPNELTIEQARNQARGQLDLLYDASAGGWGTPQKYPFAAPVEYAFYRAFVSGDGKPLKQALQTLRGHLAFLDPQAGGMYQYSLSGTWTAPHFEKIAAVQAGAMANFAEAYRVTGDLRWLEAGSSVARYVIGTLGTESGAFAASQNADVGHFGKSDFMEGARYYALSPAERRAVAQPGLDTHVYANLNGLLIRGLVELDRAGADPSLLAAAGRALTSLWSTHRRDRAFTHEASDEATTYYLNDQVEMMGAMLAFAEATGDAVWRERAYACMDFTLSHFEDADGGGYYAETLAPGLSGVFASRQKPAAENARFARILLARARAEDEPGFEEAALRALRAQTGDAQLKAQGRKVADLLLAFEQALDDHLTFSLVGPRDDERTKELYALVYHAYVPNSVLRLSTPGEGRYPYPGHPAVYLCSLNACSSPVDSSEGLAKALASFRGELATH